MNRFTVLACVLITACPAFPWGCEGHETIAVIALARLTPHARSMAERLLEGAEPARRRFCEPTGLPPFADLSTWADDIRQQRKDTAGWHFIDIPLGAARSHMSDACGSSGDCVTAATRRQIEVLRSRSAGRREQAEALLFVIHLIGDLHQPLHAATNDDRGGNCLPLQFFRRRPEPNRYHPNLHSVWDIDLVDRIARRRGPAEFADALRSEFATEMDRWTKQSVNLDDWGWESHELAVHTAYGELPRQVPVLTPRSIESCADDDIGPRMYQLHEAIDWNYLQAVSPVVRRQLARAGVRLAVVLNQIWP